MIDTKKVEKHNKNNTLNLESFSIIPVNQHSDAGFHERSDDVDGGDLQVEQLVLENTVAETETFAMRVSPVQTESSTKMS